MKEITDLSSAHHKDESTESMHTRTHTHAHTHTHTHTHTYLLTVQDIRSRVGVSKERSGAICVLLRHEELPSHFAFAAITDK